MIDKLPDCFINVPVQLVTVSPLNGRVEITQTVIEYSRKSHDGKRGGSFVTPHDVFCMIREWTVNDTTAVGTMYNISGDRGCVIITKLN